MCTLHLHALSVIFSCSPSKSKIVSLTGLLIWVVIPSARQHCHHRLQHISGPWWLTTTLNCVTFYLDWNLPECGRKRGLLSTPSILETWLAQIWVETGGYTDFSLLLYAHSQNLWWVYIDRNSNTDGSILTCLMEHRKTTFFRWVIKEILNHIRSMVEIFSTPSSTDQNPIVILGGWDDKWVWL